LIFYNILLGYDFQPNPNFIEIVPMVWISTADTKHTHARAR